MRPAGSPEILEHRRHKAMELLGKGYQPVEVARKLNVDRRSVRRWKAAYRIRGEEGIRAQSTSGRPSRLSPANKKRLEKFLLRGAKAHGFPTDLWTCPRIAQLMQNRFAIQYHVDHVCRLLHSLGWSPQRPARRAIERNDIQIQQWLKIDWPRIKKKLSN